MSINKRMNQTKRIILIHTDERCSRIIIDAVMTQIRRQNRFVTVFVKTTIQPLYNTYLPRLL